MSSSGRKAGDGPNAKGVTKPTDAPPGERLYTSAPIIDAIIELRFGDELSDADREKVAKKFASEYPIAQEVVHRGINVSVNEDVIGTTMQVEQRITKRTSSETADVIQIGSRILNVGTGAPYDGWDRLFARFVKNWAVAKRVWGFRPIERIGVRFINRLDLPPNAKGTVDYEDYLNLRINLPKEFPDIFLYNLRFQSPLDEIRSVANILSGTVPDAVPGKASFLLDIDVFRDEDVPQKDADVLAYLEQVRACKNSLFETFITDMARELFDAD
ncbi:TIGR04255 family protein [Sphingomonas sp.]|uniref:TIGR04255 family protein n=1 Tax=Sphingomonas sp. TaxID=28214 RepID=UPI0025FE6B45|nr:TIGR04255 family protein [Sphingomonas sp.]